MKPPPFRYVAATSVDEAIDALAEAGDEGKVLAGGQSLIPLLNFRLAYPEVLVDIGRIGLEHVTIEGGRVAIGAGLTHSAALGDPALGTACPLVTEAIGLVAHEAIRNRGTVGGSIAHADPAAELPAVLRLLGGTVLVRSTSETREIHADDLFEGPLQSSLAPDELLTEVSFPATGPGEGTAIVEHTRRSGDYALAGVAALARPDGTARVATIGTGPIPEVFEVGLDPDAAAELVGDAIDPGDDVHATGDQRRRLARVLTARALTVATERAAP